VRRVERVEPAVLEVVEVVEARRLPEVVPVPSPPQPAVVAAAPATANLFALLRSPQSLRTAVLLREVLGPPVCLRRRVR
jgi:hypothetical protein